MVVTDLKRRLATRIDLGGDRPIEELEAAASTRFTVAGDNSVPGTESPPTTTVIPSRCAARLLGSLRR